MRNSKRGNAGQAVLYGMGCLKDCSHFTVKVCLPLAILRAATPPLPQPVFFDITFPSARAIFVLISITGRTPATAVQLTALSCWVFNNCQHKTLYLRQGHEIGAK